MFKQVSGLAVALMMAGASAEANCYFSTGVFGHSYIQSSDSQYVGIRVAQTDENLNTLKTVCDETFKAVLCIEHVRYTGESVRIDSDLGPSTYVDLGKNFATLEYEFHPRNQWIAQFAPSYAGKSYASVQACESHRADVAIQAVENAQKAIEARSTNARDDQQLREQGRRLTPGKI